MVLMSGFAINAASSGGYWTQAANITTPTANALDTGTMTAYKFIIVQAKCITGATGDLTMIFNNDSTAGHYTWKMDNSGTFTNSISAANIALISVNNDESDIFMVFTNDATNHKQVFLTQTAYNGGPGVGAPGQIVGTGTYNQTAQITRIKIAATNLTSGYLRVIGAN